MFLVPFIEVKLDQARYIQQSYCLIPDSNVLKSLLLNNKDEGDASMKKRNLFFVTALMLVLSFVLAACGGGGDGKKESKGDGGDKKDYGIKFLSIATGGTGGTYYPLGGNFANLIKDATGIEANAITSGASAENMALIKKEETEVAFTQTDIATYATEGTRMFDGDKVENMKGLGTLYPETIQIVTTEKSGIKSVEDLKGKTVSVGESGSGTLANAEQILEVHDLTLDDVKARNLSFDDSTTGIQD